MGPSCEGNWVIWQLVNWEDGFRLELLHRVTAYASQLATSPNYPIA